MKILSWPFWQSLRSKKWLKAFYYLSSYNCDIIDDDRDLRISDENRTIMTKRMIGTYLCDASPFRPVIKILNLPKIKKILNLLSCWKTFSGLVPGLYIRQVSNGSIDRLGTLWCITIMHLKFGRSKLIFHRNSSS